MSQSALKISKSPNSRFATFFGNLFENKPDLVLGIIRNIRPNFSVPGKDGPVFITRFQDVRESLERSEIFNVVYGPMMDPSVGPFMLGRDNTTINQRDKGIMRALIQREDLPRIRGLVKQLTKETLEPHKQSGRVDVVRALSRVVPIRLTGEYFGFPGPDIDSMLRWSFATQHDMFHNAVRDQRVHQANVQAGLEMKAYLSKLITERKLQIENDHELEDILSRLLRLTTPQEIGFGVDRITTNIMGTLVGGVETTSQAVAQILQQLFLRPKELKGAILAARADDDELLFTYCWEALRFDPINAVAFRHCVEDYRIASGSLRSIKIKAGKTVLISARSAMKDWREVPSPRKFRLDRPAYHYLHLGYGLHTCLGDQISRVQIPEIIKQLLLLPDIKQLEPISHYGSPHLAEGEKSPFPESYVVGFNGR